MKGRLIILFCLLFIMRSTIAQTDTTLFLSEEDWKSVTEDIDYTETYIDRENVSNNEKPGNIFNNINIGGFKYLIYFIVLALIAYFSVRILRDKKDNATLETSTQIPLLINNFEEKIHEIDLDGLLAKALS